MSKKLIAGAVAVAMALAMTPAAAVARNDCGIVCRPSDPPKHKPKHQKPKPPHRPQGGGHPAGPARDAVRSS
jgi:hypothetical protein